MKKQNDEITIKSLVDVFVPKLWIIVLVSMLFAAILGGYSYFLKGDTYTSSEKYMVSKFNYSDAEAATGLTTAEIAAMQGMIANAQEIIDTKSFARKVIAKLHEKYNRTDIGEADVSRIRNMMSVSLASDVTTCYYFVVTSPDKDLAYQVASVAGELLVEKYGETKYAIEITCLEEAEMPGAPNGKHVKRNTAIGFAAGFVLMVLVVFLSSRFDIIIRSREKIEENFDIPILGAIPRIESNN